MIRSDRHRLRLQPAGVGIDDAHVGKRRHAGKPGFVRRGNGIDRNARDVGGSLIPVIVKVLVVRLVALCGSFTVNTN